MGFRIREYTDNHNTKLFKVIVRESEPGKPGSVKQRTFKGFETREAARKAGPRLSKQVQRVVIDTVDLRQTWWPSMTEFCEELYRGTPLMKRVARSTAEDYEHILHKWTQRWRMKTVIEITKRDVLDLLVDLHDKEGLSKARVNKVKSVIGACFNWLISEGRIRGLAQSPTRGISLGRKEESPPEILTLKQHRLLLEKARELSHPWRAVWEVASLTGMRSGELYALKWSDVDFEAARIRVCKSYCGRTKRVKSTKSGRWREVPISDDLRRVLVELQNEEPREHVFKRCTDWARGDQARKLRQFCMGIGIPPVKFHTLRACFATHLIREGVAPAVVMKIAGWQDLKTMAHYIRLAGIEIDGATNPLKLITPAQAMENVVTLMKSESGK